jgi:hypothetical protein
MKPGSLRNRAAIVLAVAPWLALSASVPLTLLKNPQARCLDGTLSGYYHQAASASSSSTKFVLFLEGGGECATQPVRVSQLNTAHGS